MTQFSPIGIDTSADAKSLNGYGQVIGNSYANGFDSHAYLWTPTSPNATTGTTIILGSPAGSVMALNDYGQVLGTTNDEADTVLWTPKSANATTGTSVSLSSAPGGDVVQFFDLSDDGIVDGIRHGVAEGALAVAWIPVAPHSASGILISIGGIGDDSGSATWDYERCRGGRWRLL